MVAPPWRTVATWPVTASRPRPPGLAPYGRAAVSSLDSSGSSYTAVDAIAGLLAALSLTLSAVALAQHPARLVPAAAILAFLAGRMSPRFSTLATVAMFVAAAAWVVGMSIAVITERPLL